jgi:hypothetical protein
VPGEIGRGRQNRNRADRDSVVWGKGRRGGW